MCRSRYQWNGVDYTTSNCILAIGLWHFLCCNRSPVIPESLGDLEDVDGGQEDTDGPPSGPSTVFRPETNFSAKAGEHIVQETIWDNLKSAVLCIR